MLSVDVEDWFQVENYAHAIPRHEWPRCELRVADNVRRLLDLFALADARATFFVLGWVAERLPDLVRDIARAGHDVASHGWSHTPLWTLSQDAFLDDGRGAARPGGAALQQRCRVGAPRSALYRDDDASPHAVPKGDSVSGSWHRVCPRR